MPVSAMNEVNAKLRKLQMMTTALLVSAGLVVLSFSGFSLYANAKLNRSLDQQEQVIVGLCDSLTRAGIVFGGSEENPCAK